MVAVWPGSALRVNQGTARTPVAIGKRVVN